MSEFFAELQDVMTRHGWASRITQDGTFHRVHLEPTASIPEAEIASATGRSQLQALARALSLALSNIQNRGQ